VDEIHLNFENYTTCVEMEYINQTVRCSHKIDEVKQMNRLHTLRTNNLNLHDYIIYRTFSGDKYILYFNYTT
jgi:hypothetical protein